MKFFCVFFRASGTMWHESFHCRLSVAVLFCLSTSFHRKILMRPRGKNLDKYQKNTNFAAIFDIDGAKGPRVMGN